MSILRTASLARSALPSTARLAVSAAAPRLVRPASTISVTSTRTNESAPLLANIEASWKDLPAEEQYEVYQQLEELQKRDWKTLTVDEKKAAYYVAFGPHGPRAPVTLPGTQMKVFLGTAGCIGAALGLFFFIRSKAPPPPKSMSKEYQEATNELMKEQKANPISGISSDGYKGKGFVTVA